MVPVLSFGMGLVIVFASSHRTQTFKRMNPFGADRAHDRRRASQLTLTCADVRVPETASTAVMT